LLWCTHALTDGQIESPFDGQWTANWGYGGTQYLCGSTVNGVFSGVWSQAGVVVGKLNGNVATGNWYEAGTGPCYTGTFNWTLSADGNTITGTVKCSDGTGCTFSENMSESYERRCHSRS